MKTISRLSLSIMAAALFLCAQAGDATAELIAANCNQISEHVSINVRFQGVSDSASKVEEIIKKNEATVLHIAKSVGVVEIKPASQNFSLNSAPGSGYNYSGYLAFQIKPYEKAIQLTDRLKAEGLQISLNVNRSNFSNCAQ